MVRGGYSREARGFAGANNPCAGFRLCADWRLRGSFISAVICSSQLRVLSALYQQRNSSQLCRGSYQLPVEEICYFNGSRRLFSANNLHAGRAAAVRRLISWRAGAVQLKPQHFPLPVTLPFRLAMLVSSRALMLRTRAVYRTVRVDRKRQRAYARGRVLYEVVREGANILRIFYVIWYTQM